MKSQPAINKRYTCLITLLGAGVTLFWLVKNLFFFDEDIFVAGNDGIFLKNLWQRAGILKLSFIADNFFWGKNPAGYHYTNLLLHLTNAVLGMQLLKALLKLIAAAVSELQLATICYTFFILFLITPVHSEPLSYILARGGSLVTLFLLLSVLFFLKANYSNKILLLLSVLSFLVALFIYEVSWMLPLIILSIILFCIYSKIMPGVKKIIFVIPYFLVFALWFAIKVVVIDKMEISDYRDEDIFSVGFAVMLKNAVVLWLRNYIPPFKSSITFLVVSASFIFFFLTGLIKLYKVNRPVFYFSLLLLVITVFSFSASVGLGIDSHDSESERYIYFSSVFAIMLLSVMFTFLFNNKQLLCAIVVLTTGWYLFFLIKTINGYNAAGNFAESYLQQIDKNITGDQQLFFVNIPSQHNGALMFRAKSRMRSNTNDKLSVMQEYLGYLYNKNNVCVTLSAKELKKVPQKIVVIEKPADSISTYFPEVKFNHRALTIAIDAKYQYTLEKGSVIIALNDSALFFFK